MLFPFAATNLAPLSGTKRAKYTRTLLRVPMYVDMYVRTDLCRYVCMYICINEVYVYFILNFAHCAVCTLLRPTFHGKYGGAATNSYKSRSSEYIMAAVVARIPKKKTKKKPPKLIYIFLRRF